MGFLCCICQEDLERRKSGGSSEEAGDKSQERPIVTTKCGHLFHSSCLSSWFHKKGAEVWTQRECPVCRMTLTVATDLVRIFPSAADDGSPSVDDYKTHMEKMKRDISELSSRLEMQFLEGRDKEKKNQQMTKDIERLQKGYIMEKTKSSQYQSEAAKLKNDNDQLRNVIVDLNLKMMKGGTNGITGKLHHEMSGMIHPASQFGGNKFGLQSQPGNTNLFAQQQQQQQQQVHQSNNMSHSPPEGSGWPPSKPVNNLPNMVGEIKDAFGSMTLNNHGHHHHGDYQQHQNQNGLQQQYQHQLLHHNSAFPIMGGLKTSNGGPLLESIHHSDREMKSYEENNNNSSSGPDSDCSRDDSETGENPSKMIGQMMGQNIYNGVPSYNNSNNSNRNSHGDMDYNFGGRVDSSSAINGKSVRNPSGGNSNDVDQSPTEEMMEAILNAKPQTTTASQGAHENEQQQQQTMFVVRNKYAKSSDSNDKKSKGKTKWKAMDYEDSNKKIYGKFYCENCTAKWGTARHVFNQAQTCMRCQESVFPYAQGPVMTKDELAQEKLNRKRKS